MIPINGRSGRVQHGNLNYNFDDCNVVFSTVTGEITGFEDQHATTKRTPVNRTDGNDDFKGTISGPIDTGGAGGGGWTGNNMLGVFAIGQILTNLKIFLDKNAAFPNRFCGSTRVIVRQVTYHPKQNEPAQRITIEFENAGGQITQPT